MAEPLFSARKRPDWLVAIAMLIGSFVPGVALYLAFDGATWAAVLSGLLGVPSAFLAGCLATWGEGQEPPCSWG